MSLRQIGLLRGVNLAGARRVKMEDLRRVLAGMGLSEVQSLLQSGNVIFRCGDEGSALEERLERDVAARLKLQTEFFVRSAKEWLAIVDGNPFADEAADDPGHLVVMLFKQAPAAADVKALREASKGNEVIRVSGRHAYVTFPDGIARSPLTTALVDRVLRTRSTARNWNTVLKLQALAMA